MGSLSRGRGSEKEPMNTQIDDVTQLLFNLRHFLRYKRGRGRVLPTPRPFLFPSLQNIVYTEIWHVGGSWWNLTISLLSYKTHNTKIHTPVYIVKMPQFIRYCCLFESQGSANCKNNN